MRKNNIQGYYEVSFRTGENVEVAIQKISELIYKDKVRREIKEDEYEPEAAAPEEPEIIPLTQDGPTTAPPAPEELQIDAPALEQILTEEPTLEQPPTEEQTLEQPTAEQPAPVRLPIKDAQKTLSNYVVTLNTIYDMVFDEITIRIRDMERFLEKVGEDEAQAERSKI